MDLRWFEETYGSHEFHVADHVLEALALFSETSKVNVAVAIGHLN